MIEQALDPRDLGRALESALESIAPAPLETFAERQKFLGGGYRKGHPAVLRAMVATALRPRLMTYDNAIAAFFREHLPEARLIAMLSPEVLTARAPQFQAFLGKARFLLALLFDARAEVRDRVPEWMAASGNELPEAEVAGDLLAQAFSPVVKLGGGPGAQARDRERIAALQLRLEALEREHKAASRQQATESRAEADDLKRRLETARFGIQERQRQIDRLTAALAREQKLRERRVNEAMAAAQITLFRGWLAPAVRAEAAMAQADATLFERAQAAIEHQQNADRASRACGALADRLAEVEAMLRQVTETLARAQVRLPELMAIQAELTVERNRLRDQQPTAAPNPIVQAIADRIAGVTSTDYEPTRALLELGEKLKLISEKEARDLRQRFRQRISVWHLEGDEQAREKDAALDALVSESLAAERRNPLLAKALCGAAPLLLFLDGHNILNGLNRYRQRRGTALSHEEARKRVEHDVRQLLMNLPLIVAHLVWDGLEMSDYNVSDNVKAHYSGGEGEHRADNYILDQLRYYREHEQLPMVVVTDDNGFAGEAARLGAAVCRLHDFEAFINGPPAT